MRTMVTGHLGFIGSHLVKLLDGEVVGYDRKNGDDILDFDNLKNKMAGSNCVIHLAADVSVWRSWENPPLYYANNVIGTSNVIQAAIDTGVQRVIFASSASAEEYMTSPYAQTKKFGEDMLEMMSSNVDVGVLRFFNVYGEGQNPEYAAAIPTFIKGVNEVGELTIYGDGEQTRDFTYVGDICRGIDMMTKFKFQKSFYNLDLGNGKSTSVNRLVELIQEISGKKVKVNYAPARQEVRHSIASSGITKEVLGFEAKTSLKEGLEKQIAFMYGKRSV